MPVCGQGGRRWRSSQTPRGKDGDRGKVHQGVMDRNGLTHPNLGYVYKGEPWSDKRPQGCGRVPVKKSGLEPLRWKAECVERRLLRLEGVKDWESPTYPYRSVYQAHP